MQYILLACIVLAFDILINNFWLKKSQLRYKTFFANILRVLMALLLALFLDLPLGLRGIEGGWLPFLAGLVLFLISYLSLKAAHSEKVVDDYLPVNNLLKGSFWETVFLLGIFVPVGEEMLFRGIVQNLFARAVGGVSAIALTLLVFVGIHYGNVISGFETRQQFFRMLLGRLLITAVLCWLYYESKSIWLPIIIHALQDLGTYLAIYKLNKKSGSEMLPDKLGEKNPRADI